jgi:Tfp pilus assembly protein PilE
MLKQEASPKATCCAERGVVTPMNSNTSKGEWFGRPVYFGLLERVIVVLVIGILMAIALPYYRIAIIKAIATEGIGMSAEGRLQVHEYYAVTGKWLTLESLQTDDPQIDGVTQKIEQGAVTMIYPPSKSLRLHGEKLTFRPMVQRNDQGMTLEWLCGYTQASDRLVTGINRTDIPREHLMKLCRGEGGR